MDNHAPARRKRRDAAQPAKPPIRMSRDRKSDRRPDEAREQDEEPRSPASAGNKTRAGSVSSGEAARLASPRERQGSVRTINEEEVSTATKMTVTNVGRGGTLYLKPSRMALPNIMQLPETPPTTSEGGSHRGELPRGLYHGRSATLDAGDVLAGPAYTPRHKTRSHSFSSTSDRPRVATFDSVEFAMLADGADMFQRSKSVAEIHPGLLDLEIPHYRLGSPRFSDKGTAYIRNSLQSVSTVDLRSPTTSRPLGANPLSSAASKRIPSFAQQHSSPSSHFLYPPAVPVAPIRTVSHAPVDAARSSVAQNISPRLFDRLEANPNDPAVVHHHPLTGRILAATPARLIAQITSPQFLNYELLSDFFLTFRCFMSAHDVLEYLLARMRWAFANASDAGRIVRVRTFVALRHWILNYFPDDFLLDMPFRERFCDLINGLTRSLRQRQDRGGSDMNIIGELKKCWQRTCELYWPLPNTADVTPDADIRPGGELKSAPFGQSVLSLPLTIRPATRGGSSVYEVAQMHIPDQTKTIDQSPRGKKKATRDFRNPPPATLNRASIPASPLSERSLEVLSCSVPFLQNLRSTKTASGLRGNKASQRHDRSGSFSDALRDKRSPLSTHMDAADAPNFTVSGGLVRGILLEPCPSKMNLAAPVSPTLKEAQPVAPPKPEERSPPVPVPERRQPQNKAVKKIVGEMRRALSTRKSPSEFPMRSHRPTQSFSDLLSSSTSMAMPERRPQTRQPISMVVPPPVSLPPPGPPRMDLLAARVEAAYHTAFEHIAESDSEYVEIETPRPEHDRPENLSQALDSFDLEKTDRQTSHLTTSSRSILIVDATGVPAIAMMAGGLPSLSSLTGPVSPELMSYRQTNTSSAFGALPKAASDSSVKYPSVLGTDEAGNWRSSDIHLHDFLTVPGTLSSGAGSGIYAADSRVPTANFAARKSSFVHPGTLDLSNIQQQLRRRPGGDLKGAENVHELSPPRQISTNTFSTNTRSAATSALFTRDPSRARLSSQLLAAHAPPHAPMPPTGSAGETPENSPPHDIRPSFESDAIRLRGIPDEESDGGIEDALMKLEGKIPSPSRSTFSGKAKEAADGPPSTPTPVQRSKLAQMEVAHESSDDSDEDNDNEKTNDGDQAMWASSPTRTETQGASIYKLSSVGPSRDSRMDWSTSRMMPAPLEIGSSPKSPDSRQIALRPSQPFYGEPRGSAAPVSPPDWHQRGFIDPEREGEITMKLDGSAFPLAAANVASSDHGDGTESVSDISTEIADQPEQEGNMHSFYFDDTTEDRVRRYQEQIRAQAKQRAPPTPPSTTVPSAKTSADRVSERKVLQKKVPTHLEHRALKETASAPKLRSPPPNRPLPQPPAGKLRRIQTSPSMQSAAHMPFILAFESEVIAEQLTIIEKDALDEVDWKDLISLNWQQNPPSIRNWVAYLRAESSNGIDVVIARFNLVVKWVISEVLLTTAPGERARAITKFIHVASHCHRLRNYASLYQITLALLSSDLIRLHKTWALVPVPEKETLAQLEALCQPVRNFNNLRVEMENTSPDTGCIPFIGLYTHDLMFNAQKPPLLEPVVSGKEPLVNFERYQTSASIVKGLLRMIEASSKYTFKPHPEALSRCLWIAALEDREIVMRSKALETT